MATIKTRRPTQQQLPLPGGDKPEAHDGFHFHSRKVWTFECDHGRSEEGEPNWQWIEAGVLNISACASKRHPIRTARSPYRPRKSL